MLTETGVTAFALYNNEKKDIPQNSYIISFYAFEQTSFNFVFNNVVSQPTNLHVTVHFSRFECLAYFLSTNDKYIKY